MKKRSINILVSLSRGDCTQMRIMGEKAWLEEYLGMQIESYSCLYEEDMINTLEIAYNIVCNVQ